MASSFDAVIRTARLTARRPLPATALAIGLLLVMVACREPVEQLLAQAMAMREAGDIRAAALKLDAAIEQQPKNVKARLLSVQIYLDLERGDAALGLLTRLREDGIDQRQIVKLWAQAEFVARRYQEVLDETADLPEDLPGPVRASVFAYRGGALEALGKTAAAQRAFEDGLAADPHSVDVRVIAAGLAIDRGDIDEARKLLAAASRATPNDRRVRQLEADIAYAAGEYSAAEQLYRKLLDLAPWDELTRGQLAAVQVAKDKLSEAISNVDSVLLDPKLRDVPKHPLLNYVRALAAFRQKDYATAQSNAAVVLAKVPGFERARLMAGASSYALNAYEQAYYYLSPYVSEHPGDIAARKLLAATQLRLGRAADATNTLGPVRNEATDDIELLQLIGEASARAGDMPTARRYLNLALKHQPDNGTLRTQLGIAEIAAGNAGAAIENLQRVAAMYPAAALPEITLFAAFLQTKDYARALATAERLKKADPSEPIGELLIAAVYLNQGKLQAGREALLRAREIRHGDIGANDTLAKLALAAGRPDKARRYFQDILDANPGSTETYIALAELESKTGRAAAAEAVLLKGLRAASGPEVAIALTHLQLSVGESEAALATATEALRKFPQNPALLEIAGNAQLALGETGDALSTFKNLTDIAPDLATGHIGLAKAYLVQFTPDNPQWQAVNEATQAVSLAPEDANAKLVLARAFALHGRFAQASDLVQELQRLKPRDSEVLEIASIVARGEGFSTAASVAAARAEAAREGAARRRKADLQLRRGDTDQAAKSLSDWLDAHPEDTETRKALAEIWVNAGRFAEAQAQYAQLAARVPKDPIFQNNLAWVLTRLDRWQEALPHARSAAALEPGSVEFLDTLGVILLRTGQSAEALGTLEAAWDKAADRGDIGFHFSQALASVGRKEEALAVLRRVLKDGDATFAERDQAQTLLQQLGG